MQSHCGKPRMPSENATHAQAGNVRASEREWELADMWWRCKRKSGSIASEDRSLDKREIRP